MMTPDEWVGWLGEEWAVIPDPIRAGAWAITRKGGPDTNQLAGFDDEDTARHIARAHNFYMKHELRKEILDDAGSEPSEP